MTLPAAAQDFITVASTTSTENSGLFDYILPIFKETTGIEVRVVAQGTGQALETGKRGDADVLFVHAKSAEEEFIAEGWGVQRFDVMYNDFVLVGPSDDPAGIAGASDAVAAMTDIARAEAAFASRGDDSGTDKAEKALWPRPGSTPGGDWYRETGSGMGATLNTAAEMPGLRPHRPGHLDQLREQGRPEDPLRGRPALFNQYGVMLVNPEKHPQREGRGRPDVHRLAALPRGPEDHRELQDRRPAALLPERQDLLIRRLRQARSGLYPRGGTSFGGRSGDTAMDGGRSRAARVSAAAAGRHRRRLPHHAVDGPARLAECARRAAAPPASAAGCRAECRGGRLGSRYRPPVPCR